MFYGLFFLVIDPHYFGGNNFFIFNPFLTIFSALDVPRGGVQGMFAHQK
jgi:hypothetical protein